MPVHPHSICVLAFGAVLSVFAIGAVLERLPQPPSLALYESVAPLYVGGYTVAGSSITQGGSAGGEIKSFSVAQECLCEVFATPTGVYAYGANNYNAFSIIAAIEPDGQWYAQQVSIGIEPAYQATMRFGHGRRATFGRRLSSRVRQGRSDRLSR